MNEEKNINSVLIGRNLYLISLVTKENITTVNIVFDNTNFTEEHSLFKDVQDILTFFHIFNYSSIKSLKFENIGNKYFYTLSYSNEFLSNHDSFEEACLSLLTNGLHIQKCDVGEIEYKNCYTVEPNKKYWSIQLHRILEQDEKDEFLKKLVSYLGTTDFCLWFSN